MIDTKTEAILPASIEIGSTTIHRIVEQEGPFFGAMQFFPTMTRELLDENRSWLQPRFIDARDQLMLCIQSYIVQTPHHTIMIDSCVGNHKPRPTRSFWNMMNSDRYEKNLAASGFGVNDIDFVMCTHLHTDHVGWNTRLENGRWVPTFPKARYVFADRELAYWTKRQQDDAAACPWITDSVLPVVAANRVDIVKSAHAFNDLVTLIPTPGHTIDHYSVQVGRPGADAIITGDMIHSPLQARYPELGMMSDYDSVQAGVSRRELFGRFCDSSTLMCTAHFPSPSTARVVRRRDAFDFIDV
jgi:glyoxylase-like metal-dependent hydrolase (beta-lactamase superfamily II)